VREVCEETGVEATLLHAARFNHPATIAHATPYAILEMQVRDARFGIHRHIDFVYVLSSRVRRTSAQLDEVQNVQWVPIADVGQLETPPELPSLISEAAEWAKLWTGHRQVHACPRVPGSVGGQVAAERAGRRG
jgi:8-oxo-dGTP pyrophosphatase MutT (NUDIX family)